MAEARYGAQSARARGYDDTAVAGGGIAAAGGAAWGVGRSLQQGAKDTMRAASGKRIKASRTALEVLKKPDLKRNKIGEPHGATRDGRALRQARADMVEADAKKLTSQRSFSAGRKIARGGRIATATGGLAALAGMAMGERARRQARNPKQAPGPVPDSEVTGEERMRRIRALAPAGRPAGHREYEEDQETGKLREKKTPRQAAYESWIVEGRDAYGDDPKYKQGFGHGVDSRGRTT
jgi:hypothetical protein